MRDSNFQQALRRLRRLFESQDVPEDLEERFLRKFEELGVRPIQISWTGYAGDPKVLQVQFDSHHGEERTVRKIRFSRDLEVLLDETDSKGGTETVRLGVADRQRHATGSMRRALGEDL